MNLAVALEPDVLEAIAATCARCWKDAHPPPPATAIYLMDDYKWEAVRQLRLQSEAAQLARDSGHHGSLNDLQHAAHREMYARSGDGTHLARMLRHVTTDA